MCRNVTFTSILYFLIFLTSVVTSKDQVGNNRLAQVTSPAKLAPRQQSTCVATATPCPDGVGCCPSGYACTTVTGAPRCDRPCGLGYTMCSGGGCCEPGYRCGSNDLCTSTGPALSIPVLSLPTLTPPGPILTSNEGTSHTPVTPPRPLSTPDQGMSEPTASSNIQEQSTGTASEPPFNVGSESSTGRDRSTTRSRQSVDAGPTSEPQVVGNTATSTAFSANEGPHPKQSNTVTGLIGVLLGFLGVFLPF
ncbi:hypothetical protein K469DRAFT_686773 [Zopfia rhizophila CBS 207.26]|uniref:Uncharacterized protein n=1 Tax=Zopfia rhizophila CBS 207.26 TaxID=1314779 RepID=A0A6A6EXG8_9PEZI|nr:hypothetical protein K469DRAFT_686773 [Zopfia rhizophila CBS 207.26]